jgi:uncharacterized membrane protein HdeD (DUF308 family)
MSGSLDGEKFVGSRATVFGIVCIVLGILAMMAPGIAGLWVATLLGVLVLLGGILRIVWAFEAGSIGRGLLLFAVGGVTALCGVMLLANPLFASGVLSVLLAVYFFLDGILEIAAGFQFRSRPGWGWLVFGGVVSILLGAVIWAQFPLSGLWAMGILLGIKLFFIGLMLVTAGSVIRAESEA